jgi:hypothetical protein
LRIWVEKYWVLNDPKRLKHIEKRKDELKRLPPALRTVMLRTLEDSQMSSSTD